MKFSPYLLVLILMFNCSKTEQKEESYYQGTLSISADASFKSVTEALAEGYMIAYPEAKIEVVTEKEDLGLLKLLQGKTKLIVMSRELSEKEISEITRVTDLPYRPDKFAADAVLFVVHANSTLSSISIENIKKGLLSGDEKFIFDGTNSSNLNFVAQKINKKPSELKFSVLESNEDVIEQLNKFPDKIGVISLNTISRPYGNKAEELRAKIKILEVEQEGKIYTANLENIRNMSYPFTRVLYFLSSEGKMGMANGFVRYSCTNLGQMIVQKEGLQKYNLYQRQVQMH